MECLLALETSWVASFVFDLVAASKGYVCTSNNHHFRYWRLRSFTVLKLNGQHRIFEGLLLFRGKHGEQRIS